jgi:chromosome segregation ATPase
LHLQTLDEISEMERGVRNVEQQLREHSQQSAVEGGRINLAYQRKKKRLDEEYEALLTAIDGKRAEIDEQDKKLEDCDNRSRKLEDNLKALERLLVEVLVDQQKKLLKILTDAGQANARYLKEKEKYAMVHGTGPAAAKD